LRPKERALTDEGVEAIGHIHIRMLLGVSHTPPSPEERERQVAAAVATFLNGRIPR